MNTIRLILYKLGLLKSKRIYKSYRYLDDFRYSYPWGKKLSDNQEQQVYLDKNVYKKDKVYEFVILKETVTLKPYWNSENDQTFYYTSGMLYSNKQYLYGSFEADIFIPNGYGLWSAFWLQGEDKVKGIREIDMFEYYGKDKSFTYSIHYGESYANKDRTTDGIKLPCLENSWHKYRIDWYPNEDVKIYIDDKLVGVLDGSPFDIPMNLIINCAIQNDLGEKLKHDLPTIMMVKNIKHYGYNK